MQDPSADPGHPEVERHVTPARSAAEKPYWQLVTDAVAECIAVGVCRSADPAHIARVLWAAAHGPVSLELAGNEGRLTPKRVSTICWPRPPPFFAR